MRTLPACSATSGGSTSVAIHSPNQQKHMQSLGEAMTGAALAPDELARHMAEGPMLDEAAVCELGLSKPLVANDGV